MSFSIVHFFYIHETFGQKYLEIGDSSLVVPMADLVLSDERAEE